MERLVAMRAKEVDVREVREVTPHDVASTLHANNLAWVMSPIYRCISPRSHRPSPPNGATCPTTTSRSFQCCIAISARNSTSPSGPWHGYEKMDNLQWVYRGTCV